MQWTNCNCIQNLSFLPLWFILIVLKNSRVHNLQSVVTTVHENSNMSRDVQETSLLLTQGAALSWACAASGSGPAQLKAALVQSTTHFDWCWCLWLLSVTPGAFCRLCCPLPPAHPSPLAACAGAASPAHSKPAFPVPNRSENHPIS